MDFKNIKSVRTHLGLSTTELSHRLGISQSSAVRLEQSESAGAISLGSLERAAAALGCRLTYSLVPIGRFEPRPPGARRRIQSLNRRKSGIGQALEAEVARSATIMSGEERLLQACSLSDLARELSYAKKRAP